MSQTYNPIELCTTVTKALLNNNFNAVRSNFSGATFPSNPVGGQFFVHTGTEPWTLYLYNSDNLGWIPITVITLDANALATFMAALINAEDVSEGAALVGYRGDTVHGKLDRVVDVKDFGAVCDGVTDDSAAVLEALDYVYTDYGQGIVKVSGRCYCASDIVLPDQVGLLGYTPTVGNRRYNPFDFDSFGNMLILAPDASIVLGTGSSLGRLAILNEELVGRYPFTSISDAADAIAAFSGTAITGQECQDILITNCRILGFAQGIYTTYCDRHKIEYVDIDCTAGVWVDYSYDVSRLSSIHCWPFLTYGYPFSVPAYQNACNYRAGAGFKTTGHFDGGMIDKCFSFGNSIGYDIQCAQNVTLSMCHSDSWGGSGSFDTGTIGYKFSSTAAHCTMIGCGASARHIGVHVNGASVKLNLVDNQFWGNTRHLQIDAATSVNGNGNQFMYLNTTWSGDYQVFIDSVSGYVNIKNNEFHGEGNTIDAIYIDNQTYPVVISDNKFINCATGIEFSSTCACTSFLQDNELSSCTVGIAYGNQQTASLSNVSGGCNIPGLSKTNSLNAYGGIASEWKTFGSGNCNVHSNYAADGTAAAPKALGRSKVIANYRFIVYDGVSQYRTGASIRAQTSGTSDISATSIPVNLVFATCNKDSTSITDRIILSGEGHLYPLTDNAYTCGANGARFASFWGANGTIQTSDERTKTEIAKSNLGLEFILDLIPISYKFIEGGKRVVEVDEEGTPIKVESIKGKRRHYGFTSQKVHEVASKFTDDFGGFILTDPADPESEQGLRYEEFISPIVKAIQELHTVVKSQEGVISKLKSRIKVLEGNLTGLVKLK